MLEVAQRKLKPSVCILYRTDGGIFNLRRLQVKSRTHQTAVVEFQFGIPQLTPVHGMGVAVRALIVRLNRA